MGHKFVGAFCVAGLFAAAPMAGADSIYLGYTAPTATGGIPVVAPATTLSASADAARNSFLAALSNGYSVDGFQELNTLEKTGPLKLSTFNSGHGYNLDFTGVGTSKAVGGVLTANDPSARFVKGLLNDNTNPRGDFTQGNTGDMANPIPGSTLDNSDNWYFDTDTSNSSDSFTLKFSTAENAIGFELNDIVQPSNQPLTVDFMESNGDSVSETISAVNAKNGRADTLANNNIWFFGLNTNDASLFISSVTVDLGKDPITLDNIYAGADGPRTIGTAPAAGLPAGSATALPLLALVGIASRYRRKAMA